MKAWYIAAALGALSLLIACVFFRDVDNRVIAELLSSLRTISPVVFAILGIWVSALDPGLILEGQSSYKGERSKLAQRLLPLVKLALVVFLIAIACSYVLSLLPGDALNNLLFGVLAGTILTWGYLLLMYVLIMTLGPVETLRAQMRARRFQEGTSEDVGTGKPEAGKRSR